MLHWLHRAVQWQYLLPCTSHLMPSVLDQSRQPSAGKHPSPSQSTSGLGKPKVRFNLGKSAVLIANSAWPLSSSLVWLDCCMEVDYHDSLKPDKAAGEVVLVWALKSDLLDQHVHVARVMYDKLAHQLPSMMQDAGLLPLSCQSTPAALPPRLGLLPLPPPRPPQPPPTQICVAGPPQPRHRQACLSVK